MPKRSQLKTAIEGEEHWTKRSKELGQFMDQKKDPEAKPYKGVRKELEKFLPDPLRLGNLRDSAV